MKKVKEFIRINIVLGLALLLVGGYPMAAFAETAPTDPASSVTTPTDTAPATDPVPITPAPTTETPPAENFVLNPTTNRWESDSWKYDPSSNAYQAVTPPAPASDSTAPTANGTTPAQNSTANTTTNATIQNGLNSDATTGNAAVKDNTNAGSAATGDATASTTIINSIQSALGGSGSGPATFVSNVVGDVHGDILLYPMLLQAMLQAANNPGAGNGTITQNNSAQISNDINLNATSGDAAVTDNTNAGNATTGNANTVANIMNMINSIVAASRSFVGTVNIYGNLDGDILISPDFIPQLLASNAGSVQPDSTLQVNSTDNQSVVNNINLNAASGAATVADNTNAGNATTGTATTNVTVLNLTGHTVTASNSLLVFVNVLGKWVGLIVDAPNGSTAAALGSGVTSNIVGDQTINTTNNSQITNNLNLNSRTGDAAVKDNTNAGNATTGNATASANVANIIGSQLGLSDWFGVLFINVFGSWVGSFGIDTASGNVASTSLEAGAGISPDKSGSIVTPTQLFRFVAHPTPQSSGQSSFFTGGAGSTGQGGGSDSGSLAADTATTSEMPVSNTTVTAAPRLTAAQTNSAPFRLNNLYMAGAIFLTGLALASGKAPLSLIRLKRGTVA
jgi:hypothetical protein